jgi:hypothetical protein
VSALGGTIDERPLTHGRIRMTTTDIAAQRRQLIALQSGVYDERAAEYSRRQAVIDVAAEYGRDYDHLNPVEVRLVAGHEDNLRQLDRQISSLGKRIAAATLIEEADDDELDP